MLHIMRHRAVTYSREAAFSALADPTRRAVLDLLRAGTRPAGDIARAFPISRPAISKTRKLLLVARASVRRRGLHAHAGVHAPVHAGHPAGTPVLPTEAHSDAA